MRDIEGKININNGLLFSKEKGGPLLVNGDKIWMGISIGVLILLISQTGML